MLDKAAYEFADMQSMLDAAEKLYGPYPWGPLRRAGPAAQLPLWRHGKPDAHLRPPPHRPGRRPLAGLAGRHELAHSWSGNLVTNATWEDFWLNEGFTNYFENRIMEQVYGKDDADMLKVLNYGDLQETLKGLKDNPEFTKLHPDLKGVNPDDYFSDVPYEKGASFLRMLEAHFGRKTFDAYLRGYFSRYAFHSMTTEAFLVDLRQKPAAQRRRPGKGPEDPGMGLRHRPAR
ncbi:MAG: M1 family aminopeptidase [Asticcacaulis sp.]